MIKTLNFSQFCDEFSDERRNTFSYEGKRALFDYLEEYEESTGEKVECDIIALCCEFDEHDSATEAASNYFAFEGMTFDPETGAELKTPEEVEDEAKEFLADNTTVIPCENGHVIIAAF
jgi:hypothetical protein